MLLNRFSDDPFVFLQKPSCEKMVWGEFGSTNGIVVAIEFATVNVRAALEVRF